MANRSVPIGLAIFMGVFTLLYLNELCPPIKEYFKVLTDVCFTDLSKPLDGRPGFFRLHVPGLDHFTCVTTHLFKDAGQTPDGLFICRELLGLFFAVLAMVAVESARPTASGFMTQFLVLGVLIQVIGVCVAVPACWLSSYWWANQQRQYPSLRPAARRGDPVPNREPSPAKILGISITLLGILLPVYIAMGVPLGEPLTEEKWRELVVAVFNPIVPLAVLLWVLVPNTPGAQGEGHKAVKRLYYYVAAAGYGFHMWATYTLMVPGFPFMEKINLIMAGATFDVAARHFLFVDLAVLFVTMVWFVALEPIEGTFFSFIALSILVGPGAALALFLVRREKVLGMVPEVTKQD